VINVVATLRFRKLWSKIYFHLFLYATSQTSFVAKKRKQVNIIIKHLNWLLGRKSNLAIENKLLIYKTIIIPIWAYGLELWGCASKYSISIIPRSQSKILRMIVDAHGMFPMQHYTPI
jgi:hypothetical protein